MKRIRTRIWIIFPEWKQQAIPLEMDLSNENVKDDEISLCIQEQVYGKGFWRSARNSREASA